MKLRSIEICNFKSYKGTHVIGPFQPFTCIIGPNGCGKSNLLDALSFVFGEKVANLRVKTAEELSYGASVITERDENQKIEASSVSATFVDSEGNVFNISRRIDHSGSEYFLENKKVSSKEYRLFLSKIGIDIRAKNFLVLQGTVESIVTKNPKERCKLLEHISGSSELAERYDSSKIQLQEAVMNASICFNKKKGVYAELKQIKLEKEEADKYQSLLDSISLNKKKISYIRFWMFDMELSSLNDQISGLNESQHKLMEDLEKFKETSAHSVRSNYIKCCKELQQTERNKQTTEHQIVEVRTSIMALKQTDTHLSKKILEMDSKIAELTGKCDQHNLEISSINNEIEKSVKEIQRLEHEQEAKKKEFYSLRERSSEEDLEEEGSYNLLKAECKAKNQLLFDKINKMKIEREASAKRIELISSQLDDLEKESHLCRDRTDETTAKIGKTQNFITTKQSELVEKQQKYQELVQRNSMYEKRKSELLSELETITEQLSESYNEYSLSSKRIKIQELIVSMKEKFPQVIGNLSSLCQPVHKRYKISLTRVLGKYMDAIVCETLETCKKCIAYMKEIHADPLTFIPLDTIEVKKVKDHYRSLGGTSKLLIDCVTFEDSRLTPAISFCFGNSLVCDTAEEARKLAFNSGERKRVVSLDGTMFLKSGVISGGSSEVSVRSKQWNEKNLDSLRLKRSTIQKQIDEIEQEKHLFSESQSLLSDISSYENQIKYSQKDLSCQIARKADQDKSIALLEEKRKNLLQSKVEEEEKLSTTENKLQILNQEYFAHENEVFKEFCKKYKYENIAEYETSRDMSSSCVDDYASLINQQSCHISQLKQHLQFEMSRNPKKQLERLVELAETFKNELSETENKEKLQQTMLSELENEKKRFDNLITTMKAQSGELSAELKIENEKSNKLKEKIQAVEREKHQKINEFNEKLEDRSNLLQRCKMENICIDLLEHTNPTHALNNNLSQPRNSNDPNEILQRPIERHIDYSFYEDEFSRLRDGPKQLERMINDLEKQTDAHQKSLKSIKDPNMKASETLEEINGRVEEISNEFDQCKECIQKLRLEFESTKKERLRRFNEAFECISSNIDEVYKILANSPSAQAFLTAENVEEPYLAGISYSCIAPGKRYRPMDSLSGGEKTMAALAMIFAIHRYRPSPLFILDEVDAALDNANINKLASFLAKQASGNCFNSLVVSLKEEFFHLAESLVGVTSELGQRVTTTKVFLLKL